MKTSCLPTLLLLTILPMRAFSQAVINGDAWAKGKLGVGTTSPGARCDVKAGSMTTSVLQVSGVDGTPFWMMNNAGRVGLSTTPTASLDVFGAGDSSDAGLELRGGNLYPATADYQITFGYNGTTDYRHAIQTEHVNSVSSSSINFLIWEPGVGSSSAVATKNVLSLVTHSTGVAVHIRPAGYADADMVVSDGSLNGGGAVLRAGEVAPSSREFKTDIVYLNPQDELAAYDELGGQKLVSFRYKKLKRKKLVRDSSKPIKRGMLYEEAPESVRRPGGFLSLDARLSNAELALKELMRRLDKVKAEARQEEVRP